MPDLRFDDPHLEAEWHGYNQTFRDMPEQRRWLFDTLGVGTYLRFGPWGRREDYLALPVRQGHTCLDIAFWPADLTPVEDCGSGPDRFSTHYPERDVSTLTGRAHVLGVEAAERARWTNSPLRVYRSPMSMLRAAIADWLVYYHGAPGIVVLRDELAVWARLSNYTGLIAEDLEHAQALQSFIRAAGARVPPIQYPQDSQREAA